MANVARQCPERCTSLVALLHKCLQLAENALTSRFAFFNFLPKLYLKLYLKTRYCQKVASYERILCKIIWNVNRFYQQLRISATRANKHTARHRQLIQAKTNLQTRVNHKCDTFFSN